MINMKCEPITRSISLVGVKPENLYRKSSDNEREKQHYFRGKGSGSPVLPKTSSRFLKITIAVSAGFPDCSKN